MKNQEIIEQAISELKSKAGYNFDPNIIKEVVEAGILDGDQIYVGGGNSLTFNGEEVIVKTYDAETHEDKVLKTMKKSELSEAQLASALKSKAKAKSQKGSSMGGF